MDRQKSRFARGRRVIDEDDSGPVWIGRQGHGRMDHRFDEEPVDNVGGHRGDHFGQVLDDLDLLAIGHSLRGRPPGGRGAGSHELHDLMGDMDLNGGPSRAGGGGLSRHDELELAELKKIHARVKADLDALGDGYERNGKAFDQGVTRLMMIEEDIGRMKYKNRQEPQCEKIPRARGAPKGSTHMDPRQSHAEGRGHAGKGKYPTSDLPKLRKDLAALDYELRHFAEAGNHDACRMTQQSIANIKSHIHRLEAGSRKGVEMHRGMGASMRPRDPRDYPDEYLDYQPCGSRRDYHERSAGYDRYPRHQSRR